MSLPGKNFIRRLRFPKNRLIENSTPTAVRPIGRFLSSIHMPPHAARSPRSSHTPIPPPKEGIAGPPTLEVSDRIRGSILLVDDDSAVREGLRRVLATEGWQVVAAKNGEEALEYLQEHEPDLIITDLCMAEVSGWDLLFHEKIQRPHLPIFVITALSHQETNGAAHFAMKFFQKPIDLDALLAAVRCCLAAGALEVPDGPTPAASGQSNSAPLSGHRVAGRR
jgi:two-component system, response regulator, stage 0 sporulation protein F